MTRFYGFHIAVLPAMATVLIGIHVLLVQLHGMHVPPRYEKNHRRMKFFPNFLMRDLIGWIVAIGILAALQQRDRVPAGGEDPGQPLGHHPLAMCGDAG